MRLRSLSRYLFETPLESFFAFPLERVLTPQDVKPVKRILSSGNRKPFRDLTNRQLFESECQQTTCYVPEISITVSSIDHEGLVLEPVLFSSIIFLQLICSHRDGSRTRCPALRDTIIASLSCVLEIFKTDEAVLLDSLADFTDIFANPVKSAMNALIAGLKCLVPEMLDECSDTKLRSSFVAACQNRACTIMAVSDYLCQSEADKALLSSYFTSSDEFHSPCSTSVVLYEMEDLPASEVLVASIADYVDKDDECNESIATYHHISCRQSELMVAHEARLAASVKEAQQLRHELFASRCREEQSSVTAVMYEKKNVALEQMLKETYDRLQIIARSEMALQTERDMLEARTVRLEADLGTSLTAESSLQLALAEHTALSVYFKSEAQGLSKQLAESIASHTVLLEQHARNCNRLIEAEVSMSNARDALENMQKVYADTISSLQDKVVNVELQLNAGSKQLETSRTENISLSTLVETLQGKIELLNSELQIHSSILAERDRDLEIVNEEKHRLLTELENTISCFDEKEREFNEANTKLALDLNKQKDFLDYFAKAAADLRTADAQAK